MMSVATEPEATRPDLTIATGELRCRVEHEGLLCVARRLAIPVDLLRAAVRGRQQLHPERVVALRLGADLRPLVRALGEIAFVELSDA
ncbi:MAG: hypothetical protein SFX73_17015 [Kofleriaceae bacterium]|nr:hypothetical protein [Kofleriaceae bacterium]